MPNGESAPYPLKLSSPRNRSRSLPSTAKEYRGCPVRTASARARPASVNAPMRLGVERISKGTPLAKSKLNRGSNKVPVVPTASRKLSRIVCISSANPNFLNWRSVRPVLLCSSSMSPFPTPDLRHSSLRLPTALSFVTGKISSISTTAAKRRQNAACDVSRPKTWETSQPERAKDWHPIPFIKQRQRKSRHYTKPPVAGVNFRGRLLGGVALVRAFLRIGHTNLYIHQSLRRGLYSLFIPKLR